MKKFVVHTSDYMDDEPTMEMIEAESLTKLLLDVMGTDEEEFKEDYGKKSTDRNVMKAFREYNGDGCPLVTIMDLETEKVYS